MMRRVRTLTGKEIELDIEPDYRVRSQLRSCPPSCASGAPETNTSRQFPDMPPIFDFFLDVY